MSFKKVSKIFLGLVGVGMLLVAGWVVWRQNSWDYLPVWMQRYFGLGPTHSILELQGNVEIREVRLGLEVAGRITRLHVEEGDRVSEGQLLAELETNYFEYQVRQAKAALESAQAELLKLQNGARPEEIEQARANLLTAQVGFSHTETQFARFHNLLPQKAISQEIYDNAKAERDRAKAQLQAAQAALKLLEAGFRVEDIARAQAQVALCQAKFDEAQRRLRDSQLIAPGPGVVQTRVREVGEWVNVGEPIYTLAITDPVWIRTYVNGMDLERVRPGMEVTVRTDGGKTFAGRIGFISPTAEFTPKSVQTREIRTNLVYRLRVIAADPQGELRQGMPVTVLVPTLSPKGG